VTDDPILSALPDDIEQFLRATFALAERRGISFDAASEWVGRWLFDRRKAIEGKPYGRRKDDRPT
jgi:hypothetical protein